MSITLLSYVIAGLIAVWGILLLWGIVALIRRLNRAAESRLHFSPLKRVPGMLILLGILAFVGYQLITNTRQTLQVGGLFLAIIAGLVALGGLARFNDWLAKRIGREQITAGHIGLAQLVLAGALIGFLIEPFITALVLGVLAALATIGLAFRAINHLLQKHLPFSAGWFWFGLSSLVIYGFALYVYTAPIVRYTRYAAMAVATLTLVILGLVGIHRLLKPRLPFKMEMFWFGVVILGAYVGLWFPFPLAAGLATAAVALIAAIGLLIRGLVAGSTWIQRRYQVNPLELLFKGIFWIWAGLVIIAAIGIAGYGVYRAGNAIYANWQQALAIAGVGLGLALIGYLIYWLNKWLDPILQRRYNKSFGEVAAAAVSVLIIAGGVVGMLFTAGVSIANNWSDFVKAMRVVAIVIGGLVGVVFALAGLVEFHNWLMRRYNTSLWVWGARLLLIPMAAGAIYMIVLYTNYASMLRDGSVVSGEIVDLDETGTAYRVQYTYDPNRGDPPDFRTQWQTVPEAFYEDREMGQSIPIYFLRDDKDNSSVTVVTDALESSMLATVLILGTPLWGLGVFIHWRRKRLSTLTDAAATPATDATTPTDDLQQSHA